MLVSTCSWYWFYCWALPFFSASWLLCLPFGSRVIFRDLGVESPLLTVEQDRRRACRSIAGGVDSDVILAMCTEYCILHMYWVLLAYYFRRVIVIFDISICKLYSFTLKMALLHVCRPHRDKQHILHESDVAFLSIDDPPLVCYQVAGKHIRSISSRV